MPAADVAELLDRWGRARTRHQQLRVAAAGARTLRSSSPADRRVLAQALLEHGAPQVAARLDAAAVGPLSAQELTDLAGVLRQVDPATLEAVAATIADPAEHERLLTTASPAEADGGAEWDDAAHDGAEAAPWNHAPPPPPTGAPTGPVVALPPPAELLEDPDDELAPPAELELAPDEPAPAADLDEHPSDETPSDDAPSDDAPADDAPSATAVAERPPSVDIRDVLGAVDRAPTVLDRLREVTELAGRPLEGADLVTVLRALPDGWQRRTAAKRLLAAGGTRDVDAAEVLGVLGRPSDRTAVARILVAAGLTDVATVRDRLDPAAAARLRAAASRS